MPEDNLGHSELFQKLEEQKKGLKQLEEQLEAQSEVQEIVPLIPKETFIQKEEVYNPAEDGGLWLSGMILSFSLIVIGLISYLIKLGSDLELLLKVFGTILIIVAAVFLIVAGYSEKQIAPVIGLLGTLAGYLLGKQLPEKKSPSEATRAGADER